MIYYNFNNNKYYTTVDNRCNTYNGFFIIHIKEVHFHKKEYTILHNQLEKADRTGIINVGGNVYRLHVGDTITDMDSGKVYEYVVDKKNLPGFCLKYIRTEQD